MIVVIQNYFYYNDIIEYNQEYCKRRCYDYILLSLEYDAKCILKEFSCKYSYIVYLNQPIKLFDDLFNCEKPTVYYLNYKNEIIVLPNRKSAFEFLTDWDREDNTIYFIRKYIKL